MSVAQYIRRPQEFTAYQFEGGQENGLEIVNYLNSQGGLAMYLGPVQDEENPANNRPEQIRISGRSGPETVLVTDFIVELGGGDRIIMSQADFHKIYAPA